MKLVSCISAFILVLGIFIFGVLSAEQATVNLGGSISFDATDVYARVTGKVQNAQTNPTLDTLEFSAYNDTPDQSSWSGLDLQFDSRATNITIEVTVENLSMERELTVNLTDMIQTSTDNLDKSITLDNGAYVSGTNTTIPVATSNDENNTSKITFVITFDVLDHNRSLPSTTFDYDINLYDESYTPPTPASSFEFSFDDENHTASITDFVGSETEVIIPATVNNSTDTTATEGSDFTVTSIGDYAFRSCSSLTSITIPSSVTSIGDYAFDRCTSLTSVDFGENSLLTSIGDYAFYYCSSLTSITIPEGVTRIRDRTFYRCSNLTSITIPSGVKSIGFSAFAYCYALAEVYNYSPRITVNLGETSSSNYLGQYAKVVYNARDLTGVKPETRITVVDNVQYYDYGDNFIALAPAVARRTLTEVTLDNRTSEINIDAFSSCDILTSITIPESVTSISDSAFSNCDILTLVDFGENSQLTSIGGGVFSNCDSLTSITIPNTVTSIGPSAFSNCDILTLVDFGENSQLTSIGDRAFGECNRLTSITIPDSVTSIGKHAFNGCSSLTSITIPNTVTSVDNYAFYGCSSLTSITIPDTVTSIGQWAFQDCSNLTSVDFGENSQLTSISDSAFQYCNSLTSITIPNRVTSIDNSAFRYCSSLNDVTIESDDIYLALTSQSACGYLIYYVDATGETVRVLKSVVDSVETDITANPVNTYLNGSNFKRSTSEDGLYYVYTHI